MTGQHADEHGGGDARRLGVALILVLVTAAGELWGSIVTGSLALLSDMVHVSTDFVALALALVSVRVAARPHTLQWTFGFHRIEILAAALNGLSLLVVSAFIVREALARIGDPGDVHAAGLTAIAAIGLGSNAVTAVVLGHSHSMNMRAARLHVLSDLGGSVVAVIAGVAIGITGATRIDPVLSLVIVALVVVGAVRLLRAAVEVLMDRVPRGIDLAEVEGALLTVPGVAGVHDMHCWTIASGFIAFAAHLQLAPGADPQMSIEHAATILEGRYGIAHTTLQPEQAPSPRLVEFSA
ncbi:MAG: cation diffusion facilitator family transporter [Dehalococcoidia bacterium]